MRNSIAKLELGFFKHRMNFITDETARNSGSLINAFHLFPSKSSVPSQVISIPPGILSRPDPRELSSL